ncbi:hypothetical protein [Spirosoma spitsbergense]|uniref:hypothetical protein n=1 Tax=Spirosoma spitsbergense TaxID=431554 RepID=UPI0003646FDA|nr:hypothetical protein [Spirosoma spitsbergense]
MKLLLCKLATVIFGVLAVGALSRTELVMAHLRHGDMLGASLALVSTIFGTQWVEYRKRTDTTPFRSIQPGNRVVSEAA